MSHEQSDTTGSIDSVTDPEALPDQRDVRFTEEVQTLEQEAFDHWRDSAGLVGVGVTAEGGRVMVWNGVHGWTLPYVEVGPDEDFAEAARTAVDQLTGVRPTLTGIERATRVEFHLANGDATLTTHQLVFGTDTVDEETAAAMVSDNSDVRWITELDESGIEADDPEDIEDEAEDILRFLD